MPYTFAITARDNACPRNGVTVKTYAVSVKQAIVSKRSFTEIKNGLYQLKSEPDKSFKDKIGYSWTILDSISKPVDSSFVDFNRTGSAFILNRTIDSVQFRKPGKYIIKHTVNSVDNCPTTYFDTLKVGSIVPFLKVEPDMIQERWVCEKSTHTLSPVVKNAKAPVKFRWSSSKSDTFQTLKVSISKDTIFKLDVYDGAGYHRTAQWHFHLYKEPLVKGDEEILSCKNDTVSLVAGVSNASDTIYWSWYFEGSQISDQKAIQVVKPGQYIIEIKDRDKCSLKIDTVTVANLQVNANGGLDKSICIGNSIVLRSEDTADSKTNTFEWYELLYPNIDTLISSSDTVLVNPTSDKIYFIKQTVTEDSMKCSDNDSVMVKVNQLPEIVLTNGTVCQNERELDLNTVVLKPADITKGVLTWKLLKTLPKPGGGNNTLNDLVYDKDPGTGVHYYLKVDTLNIEVPGKFKDSVLLSLVYKDEFGCENTSTNSTSIVVRTNVNVVLNIREISLCMGDSLTFLSNDHGVNYYGGKWFTENDSAGYLKWPQGDQVDHNEKIFTDGLSTTGGRYMSKYELVNNGCTSVGNGIVNVLAYPEIEWSQSKTTDSVTLTDKTKNITSRAWSLNGTFYSSDASITLDKVTAFGNTIKLSVTNSKCETDSIIVPEPDMIGINLIGKKEFRIYPNPVSGSLTIESDNNIAYRVSIVNLLGQTVLEREIQGGDSKLDVGDLGRGPYILMIYSGDHTYRRIFIKE